MIESHFFIIWKKNILNARTNYFIENFISKDQNVSLELIEKNFSQNIGRAVEISGHQIGIFNNEEEIHRFAFSLSQQLNLKEVILINLEHFNHIIEKQFSKDKLLLDLFSVGEKINNPDFSKKNVFKRMFS